MPRRIELELTSERPDGTWTWRAAGAREPRGEVEASLLPGGVKVGDVLRVEADITLDGITILSVLPPKGERAEPERIEILGPQREFTPVTSTLVGKGDRDRGPRRERRDRPDRADRGERGEHGDRPPRPRRDERPRRPRPEGAERPRRERPAPPPPKPKPKKLRPTRANRDALLAGLSPEQVPIAEQLFRGGMPSVRQALDEQNAKAKAEGLPEMPSATVLGIAEDLLPRVRVADWLDRAEAAVSDAEEIALRDVLERRAAAEQDEWLNDVKASLQDGRVVRALRLSSRPPQPGENLPEDLNTELTNAANTAMTAEITSDRWATLLDAVAYSPVRRTLAPAGIPAEPTEELLAMVRKHAGRVPTVASLFGIEPPAPPAPKRAPRAPRPKPKPEKASHPPLPPLPGGGRRIPPPPRPSKPASGGDADDAPASESGDSPHLHGDELPADAPMHDAPMHEATSATVTETPTSDDDAPVVLDHDAPGGDELPADAPEHEVSVGTEQPGDS